MLLWESNDYVTLSNDFLTVTTNKTLYSAKTNIGINKGKYYWEMYPHSNTEYVGIMTANTALNINVNNINTIRYYEGLQGHKYPNNTLYGTTFNDGDTIGIALDMDNGTIIFYKNGISQGIAFTDLKTLGTVYPSFSNQGFTSNNSCTINGGGTPFQYPVPSEYKPLGINNKFLIKQGTSYYSIKPEFYAEFTHSFTPLTLTGSNSMPNDNDYNTFGFDDIGTLTQNVTTGSITGVDKGNLTTGKYFECDLISDFVKVASNPSLTGFKALIEDETGVLYTYSSNAITSISKNVSAIADTDFTGTNGISDLTAIINSAWTTKFTTITNGKILIYTSDQTITKTNILYNSSTINYRPFDKFGENKITGATFTTTDNLTYTVNPTANIPFKKDSVVAYENGTVVTPSSIDLANGKVIFSTARTGTMTFDYTWINKFNIMMYKPN